MQPLLLPRWLSTRIYVISRALDLDVKKVLSSFPPTSPRNFRVLSLAKQAKRPARVIIVLRPRSIRRRPSKEDSNTGEDDLPL